MWVHRLTEIEPEARTAVCQHCGPVKINRKGYNGDGSIKWRCATGFHAAKRPHRAFKTGICERCNFEAEDECQLDVHHKDGDHFNNAPGNLQTLCANCHRLVERLLSLQNDRSDHSVASVLSVA